MLQNRRRCQRGDDYFSRVDAALLAHLAVACKKLWTIVVFWIMGNCCGWSITQPWRTLFRISAFWAWSPLTLIRNFVDWGKNSTQPTNVIAFTCPLSLARRRRWTRGWNGFFEHTLSVLNLLLSSNYIIAIKGVLLRFNGVMVLMLSHGQQSHKWGKWGNIF